MCVYVSLCTGSCSLLLYSALTAVVQYCGIEVELRRRERDREMKRKSEREMNILEEAGEANALVVEHGNVKGDEGNIAILLFLYLLQGIPLGLCSSIPMLLQNRGVSYKQQVRDTRCLVHAIGFLLYVRDVNWLQIYRQNSASSYGHSH